MGILYVLFTESKKGKWGESSHCRFLDKTRELSDTRKREVQQKIERRLKKLAIELDFTSIPA